MVTQEEIEKMSPEEIAKLQKENCIFCKIIKGQIPSKKVYEDDQVLAILDINPGTKGHVLVMPKEHYPILPLIPPEVFSKLFTATKIINKAMKKAMLTDNTTIFLANGAVAGQQSPHFLFHIFPREKNDALTNFSIKENPAIINEQKELFPMLQNNLNMMLSKLIPPEKTTNKKEEEDNKDKKEVNNIKPEKNNPKQLNSEELLMRKQEIISQILDEYEDVRNSLIANPKKFREDIKNDEKLKKLFEGVDLGILAEQLKKIYPETKTPPKKIKNKMEIQKKKENNDEQDKEINDEPKFIEPFLGEHPTAQREAVFKYLDNKPQAKQLLIKDPKYFQELLEKRPDVKSLFKDVDINLLSEELKDEAKK